MGNFIRENLEAILSLALLVVVVLMSLGLFFSKFNGGLSSIHSNWGDFGSFISGTIGVVAACLAVIWLIISVRFQKIELSRLKAELERSAEEQKNQTHISALTALVNSSQQVIAGHQNDLIARKNGVELEALAGEADLRVAMDAEWRKLAFYEKQLESYLKEVYPDPYGVPEEHSDSDLLF